MTSETCSSPLYAVIDLGSNSFHMLITRQLADSIHIVDKVKRKVRLASGLDENNCLNEQAIARGLECLSFFAERLQDIPKENVRIVATATVRLATNQQEFLQRANQVLGQEIRLLTGEQEAEYIYQGVANTSCGDEKRLVLDIGGASTEIVVGQNTKPLQVVSLNIGCVTFNQYFVGGELNVPNFEHAISAARQAIDKVATNFKSLGWQQVLGGSGTMQALAELLQYQGKAPVITATFLSEVKQQLIAAKNISQLSSAIDGLGKERAPVLASGVAILTALFESLSINELKLASGALREGLLYEMLPSSTLSVRARTVNSLMTRFHVDSVHANHVKQQATFLYQALAASWDLSDNNYLALLETSCLLHEIGLLIGFKHHQQHSNYLLQSLELPGFNNDERQIIRVLVTLYKGDITDSQLAQIPAHCTTGHYLLAILRLAVILCRRRTDDVLPDYQCLVEQKTIKLCLPVDWLNHHPLIADELLQENDHLSALGLSLSIQC